MTTTPTASETAPAAPLPSSLDVQETPVRDQPPPTGLRPHPSDAALRWHPRHTHATDFRILTHRALIRTAAGSSRTRRFAECGHRWWLWQSTTTADRYQLRRGACHDRLCPACSTVRAIRMRAVILDWIGHDHVRCITLTLRHTADRLMDRLDRLYACFRQLRHTPAWRKYVTGGIGFVEVRRNPNTNTWHVHLHVLAKGTWWPQADLAATWKAVTGDSDIVDIRLLVQPHAAASYVTKYATKLVGPDVHNSDRAFDEYITAIKGRKLLVTFGTARSLKLLTVPPDPDWQCKGDIDFLISHDCIPTWVHDHALAALATVPDNVHVYDLYCDPDTG